MGLASTKSPKTARGWLAAAAGATLAVLLNAGIGAGGALAQSAVASATKPGVIGLVMGEWRFALHETPGGKQECPEGFHFDLTANYNAEYPTPEARKAREERYGYYTNRGPNGENVFYHPTTHRDLLPFRAVHGGTAIGLNLDGEAEGKGAGSSLPHDNFTSPSGERGIDNQLYRVIGCTPGWRVGGGIVGPVSLYIRSENYARVLLEITGVDNELNDADVTVALYRGLDGVAVDSRNRLVPWLSQRIDSKYGRRFMSRFKGRIVDGVLTTEPTDVRLPFLERPIIVGDRLIHQMRLRLKLTPDGAEGMLGGYADLDNWYLMYAKTWGAHKVADIEGWDGPATYEALHRFADYRDPKTGAVTGISAAYEVGFTRAFIVHTPPAGTVLSEAGASPTARSNAELASR